MLCYDATITAGGMAKHGVTQIAVNKQQAIEGFSRHGVNGA
jgi:hypothetical protein